MMEEQKKIKMMGGTMRLGAYPCEIEEGSLAHQIYGDLNITERHRHRYEFNNAYKDEFKEHGMDVSGIYPKKGIAEIIELKNHPFFIATQAHPELLSRPTHPHPLVVGFIQVIGIQQMA
jgi:CTP synthase